MSQENLDRFTEAIEAINRASEAPESFDVDSWLGFYDPDVVFEPQQAALQGSYVGHDGVRQWLADAAEHYGPSHLHFADVRDLGDRVLALGTFHLTGRGSGIETEIPVALVVSFRDGMMTRFKDYGDKDQALEAAGLQE